MLPVALHSIVTIDIGKLQKNILAAYNTDPAVQSFHADSNNSKYSCWSVDNVGFIQIDQQILIPDSGDLRLHVLQSFHDHPVSGHFGVNKTLSVIQQEYTWPNIWEYVADYVKSCTTCARSKAKQHKPYGLLCQLPILLRPWESISMDFIKQLPNSEGFTAILVVVDHFTKQALFILTHLHPISWTFHCPCLLQAWSSVSCHLRLRFQIRVSFLPFSWKGPEYEVALHFGIPSRRQWTNGTR
jgi:Integrase zinc binding domain